MRTLSSYKMTAANIRKNIRLTKTKIASARYFIKYNKQPNDLAVRYLNYQKTELIYLKRLLKLGT